MSEVTLKMQSNLKKLAFTCIRERGVLQEIKAGVAHCSMLPLEGENFPCPYSGAVIDVGERFERYRCFYQKVHPGVLSKD